MASALRKVSKAFEISQATVRAWFFYEPNSGLLLHRRVARGVRVLDIAGGVRPDGYRQILVQGVAILAHRVVWMYHHGEWPPSQVDHLNGDRDDNRIENLRDASPGDNCHNRALRSDSKTGLIGVGRHRATGRFQARIGVGGKRWHLGFFDTAEQAHAAYVQAKAQHHAFQPEVRA